jgi:hypothetical protein
LKFEVLHIAAKYLFLKKLQYAWGVFLSQPLAHLFLENLQNTWGFLLSTLSTFILEKF